MNFTMEKRYWEALESGDTEKMAQAEIKFRKRAEKVSEVLDKLFEIRTEYYDRMKVLEQRRLELERAQIKVRQCRPRQSGKSKVKVEMTTEQLISSLTPEQQLELLQVLKAAANAGK